jgi:hypothetical protein
VRHVISTLLLAGIAGTTQLTLAAAPDLRPMNIPVEDLGTALFTLAQITHQQIAFDYKSVQGYQSGALAGNYTVADALHALIGSAPLAVGTTPSGVLTVVAKPVSVADAATTVTEQRTLPAALAPLASRPIQDEVIISAHRMELERRIHAFIDGITVPEHGEGLARWHMPVCPQVSGLTREDGEFILWRISDVARAANVPLAGEYCRPNLFVLVTSDPKQVLADMAKRNFGHATRVDFDEFISTPRVVRVWYDTRTEIPGTPAPAKGLAPQITTTPPIPANKLSTDFERTSRVMRNVERAVTDVYIVVDKGHVQGTTLGQLADYVAMVGLTQIRPGPQLSDAPTILRLFDASPQSAVAGMSDWDRAFIKSLYSTEPMVTAQSSAIARDMMREILQ